ncbi:HAD family hydrolase [Nitrosophilus alvini]|uniref:HAD family hydrolase n=1 Tax=Nitrosophilus alvini TaxID=2714855 RepID=UPI001909EDEA|nr:HAD family hydrolase [Nitrosophilus alvini]
MINYIIFDMDGTLVDSSEVIANSINYVRKKLGLEPMPKREIIEAVNDPALHAPKFFYNKESFEKKHIEWFQEYYTKNHHKEVRLYTGIKEFLNRIKPCFGLSLATNAYRISAMQILEHLHIKEYFEIIVCADDVAHPKPAPDMLLKIIDYFGCKKDEIILIGDGPKDKEAAKNAGIRYMMVNWGFSDYEEALRSVDELTNKLFNDKNL